MFRPIFTGLFSGFRAVIRSFSVASPIEPVQEVVSPTDRPRSVPAYLLLRSDRRDTPSVPALRI